MVKYQFLQLAAKTYCLGERRKRRWGEENEHEASDYKIKKYWDSKGK